MAIWAVLAGLILACGSGGASVGSVAPATPTVPTAEATQLCTAPDALNVCTTTTASFAAATPAIHASVVVHGVDGSRPHNVHFSWIAAQVAGAAANTPVVQNDTPIPSVAGQDTYTVHGSMSLPHAWPAGSYRVDITLDGAPLASAPFTITP